ncbi:type II toxin-antitoxin system RelE/ParE family toxin [uncultured Roseibium sp.]|uniref:type II toxin-antitoxin system RelE/ParE family toxin n=1 Tax=uncultured Roseibium sp. TaxID=1936171 RepID=UPI0026220BE9|nr:type II toxin-antitoxin system RelE/ParE family toxin [uncultured Roseibium sp.]
MKQRDVVFAPEAREDLIALYSWIATKADPDTALSYIERIETFCNHFDFASERGQQRDDIRPGLRIVGFEKRLTIAFIVSDTTVTILRVFYGGQNWEEKLG